MMNNSLSTRSAFSARFWSAQAAVALFVSGAYAQTPVTYTWDGGDAISDNWSAPANWAGDVAPSNPALPAALPDIIVLSGTAGSASHVDAPWVIDALTFGGSSNSFELTGETITLQPSNGTTHDNRYFLQNSSGTIQTINNDLIILPAINTTSTKGSGISVGSGTLVLNGDINMGGVTNSGLRIQGGNGTAVLNGVLSGSFGDTVAVNGGATAVMNAVNTFTSNFTVWSGTAKVMKDAPAGAPGALGNSNNAVTIGHGTSNGGRLLTSAAVTIGRGINMVGNSTNRPYTIGGDTADISHFTGTINNGSTAVDASANAVIVTAAAGGRVNISGITRRDNASAASALQDTLKKEGAGIVALTESSNYSGQTNVTAGTLLVNGILTPLTSVGGPVGDVVVSDGGTLGGAGFLYRNTVVEAGGIFAPGDINASGISEGGKLTLGTGLTFADTSILRFDLGSPADFSNDTVDIDGNLTLDGVLNVTALSGFGVGSYKLFDYSSTFVNNGLSLGDMPAGFSYSFSFDSGTSAVYLNVVPEPATGVLLGIGAVLALVRRRRS